MNTKKKYFLSTMLIVVILILLSVGYAYLSSNLNINGSSSIKNASWNIYFNNVQVTTGSVSATIPVINPSTTVTYDITLENPGDFYEFTVDVVNGGTIDAMIDEVTSSLNNAPVETLPNYLNYSVSYSDGTAILEKQELDAGATETYKVRVEYRRDIDSADLPTSDQNLSFLFTTIYSQKDNTSIPVDHPSPFAVDSWETIISAVRSGNTSMYNVGDTRDIDLGSLGTHTLRIANKSTPTECSNEYFSQTACGFVIEFSDIITTHVMNYVVDYHHVLEGNDGGWEHSSMRSYVNSTIYNAFPADLRNIIIDTTVISGYGTHDSANFITTDKLYLLAQHEVYTNLPNDPNGDYYDTAYDSTRQLDYYSEFYSTGDSNDQSWAIKQYNGADLGWWLRSINNKFAGAYYYVQASGSFYDEFATNDLGLSPAFRIG